MDRVKWLGRKKPGRKGLFSNFMKYHALFMKRGSKVGGVDYMRYIEEVLKPILIPWIQNLNRNRLPGTPCFVF